MSVESPPFALLGDSPYEGMSDPLAFSGFADDLARLILTSRGATPFTLGVEASWGMGKSSLMGQLHNRLQREPGVTAVWFNAWTADDRGVLEGLVKTVLNEMDASVLRRALRNHKLMSWLRVGVSVLAGWLRLTSVVDELWKRVAADPRARNELRALVEQAVTAWRDKQAGAPTDALLCVFVDDLDRCTPDGVLEVFEAMKLYMNVRGFVFVVGYDRDIVSDLINKRHGYSDAAKSQDYLEKIIQTTFRIPRSSREQSDALVQTCLDSSGTTALFGVAERRLVIERNGRNPRKIKRFLNGFVLSYGLDSQWRRFKPEHLIRVHLLFMYFKPFADLLERRAERDPVQEFQEYSAARDVLRRRAGDWVLVEAAFESHRLPRPAVEDADHDALLAQLEDNVPVVFKPLAGQDGFGSLVATLAAAPDWPALCEQIAEGGSPGFPAERDDLPDADVRDRFAGLSVIWVDDDPENNATFVDELQAGGAFVIVAEDTENVRMVLEHGPVDVLISDIGRGGQFEAGFEDLRQLRADGLAPRAVFFFTSRATPARLATAEELGASICTGPNELFRALAHVQRGSQPAL